MSFAPFLQWHRIFASIFVSIASFHQSHISFNFIIHIFINRIFSSIASLLQSHLFFNRIFSSIASTTALSSSIASQSHPAFYRIPLQLLRHQLLLRQSDPRTSRSDKRSFHQVDDYPPSAPLSRLDESDSSIASFFYIITLSSIASFPPPTPY